jgi:hypothetical protein
VIVGKPTNIDALKAAKLHGGIGMISHRVMKAINKS